jgi:signal transduction histidine kinase
MPEMNGFEVCRILKQDQTLSGIPVIFISALTDTFDKVTAFETGGVDFITKPFQIAEALARVRTHLALRRYQHLLEIRNYDLKQALDRLQDAQSQLINSEKLASLGVLTAGIAHEINNPISFIYSSSLGISKNIDFFVKLQEKYEELFKQCNGTLIQELTEFKDQNDFRERMDELSVLTGNIVNGAKRITGIVQSLRHFARIDEADMKEIDIHENIDSTLLLLQHKISNRIRVVKNYGPIPPVPCYPARLSQVLMNIISNGIDAIEAKKEMTDHEQITITTNVIENNGSPWVAIEITDTGKGIPENIITKMFDPFFTTKPVGKGMGLGLSISSNIIREHGGIIEAKNLDQSGASFLITLPVQKQVYA